jgi:RNA binding protein fox-1
VGNTAVTPTAPATPLPQSTQLVLAQRAAQRRSVYYDPFLAAAASSTDPTYRLHQAAKPVTEVPAQTTLLNNLQATAPLLKTPLSQAHQAYAAHQTYTVAAARAAYGAAAAAAAAQQQQQQPVAGYVTVAGYGREYADPYSGHGIGPVPGYGAAMYRSGYNRFAPY